MKLNELLANSSTVELKDSNGKINQTDRNTLRNALLNALCEDLNGVMTADGIILEFEHEYWGSLCVEVSLKMKDPNFDLDTAVEEYNEKLLAQETKKIEAMKRAAERQAKADATKGTK